MKPDRLTVLARAWLVLGIGFAVFIGCGCLTPSPPSPPTDWPFFDKVEHGASMGFLAAWFGWLYRDTLVRVALSVMVYGGIIEIVQTFLGYRDGDILDFGADCAGVLIGIGAVVVLSRIWPARSRFNDTTAIERGG